MELHGGAEEGGLVVTFGLGIYATFKDALVLLVGVFAALMGVVALPVLVIALVVHRLIAGPPPHASP